MPSHRAVELAIIALIAGGLTACDKSPTAASPPLPPPLPPAAAPALQSIQIQGPTTVAPGARAQFTVTGQISDGTTVDLTSVSTWRSSDSAVLSIADNGEAAGGKAGEVVLAAEKDAKRASLQVLVLAPGTFRVTGAVTDSGIPIAGATVDLLDGSRAAMTTQTDAQGIYRLYGVAGPVELRVRAPGYPEQVHALAVTGDAHDDFALLSTGLLSGSYDLTIAVDSAVCPPSARNALPADLRTRTYNAAIAQTGPQLSVKLTGASLTAGSFSGTVNGGVATFDIRGITTSFYYYYSYFEPTLDLVEQLSPSNFLVISGKATAAVAPDGLSGTLQGVMGVTKTLSSAFPSFNPVCYGKKRFALTRRQP